MLGEEGFHRLFKVLGLRPLHAVGRKGAKQGGATGEKTAKHGTVTIARLPRRDSPEYSGS